jgi:hypothetical protein
MDVIDFLYVSLGSSTVQLHDSLSTRRAGTCSEAGFSSQNNDHASGVYNRIAAFCCAFYGQKDTHKGMFPIYGGKCLSHKEFHK